MSGPRHNQPGTHDILSLIAPTKCKLHGTSWCLQVMVRIRPPHSKDVKRWSKEQCVHALSTCSLAIAPPEDSQGCEPAL